MPAELAVKKPLYDAAMAAHDVWHGRNPKYKKVRKSKPSYKQKNWLRRKQMYFDIPNCGK